MRTLIIGASGGIGAALMAQCLARNEAPNEAASEAKDGRALADRPDSIGEVIGLSRSKDGFDLTDEASIAEGLGRLEGRFDRIICATGALEISRPGRAEDGVHKTGPGKTGPEKSLRALDPQVTARHFALNATGPILVLKHALRLLPRDRPARFAALSARVGSIGDNRLGGWYSYRAAKAALNQLLHTAAIEIARSHPQAVVVALHPGTVATGLTQAYQASHPTVPPQAAAADLLRVLDGLTPAQSGGFFDARGAEIVW